MSFVMHPADARSFRDLSPTMIADLWLCGRLLSIHHGHDFQLSLFRRYQESGFPGRMIREALRRGLQEPSKRPPPAAYVSVIDRSSHLDGSDVRLHTQEWYEILSEGVYGITGDRKITPAMTLVACVGADVEWWLSRLAGELAIVRGAELSSRSPDGVLPPPSLAAELRPRAALPAEGGGEVEVVEVVSLESDYWEDTHRRGLVALRDLLDGGRARLRLVLKDYGRRPEPRLGAAVIEHLARVAPEIFWQNIGCGVALARGSPWEQFRTLPGLDVDQTTFEERIVTEGLDDGYYEDTRTAMLCGVADAPPIHVIGREVYYLQYGSELERFKRRLRQTAQQEP